MVLGFIRDTLGPGTLVGFEKRWHEIDAEKAASAKAHAKALKDKIDDWSKNNSIESFRSGDLLANKDWLRTIPDYVPISEIIPRQLATKQWHTREQQGGTKALIKRMHAGEIPVPNISAMTVQLNAGRPLKPIDMQFYNAIQNNDKIFNEYGGLKLWEETASTNWRMKDDERYDKSLEIYGQVHLGREFGPELGRHLKLQKSSFQGSSFFGGPGANKSVVTITGGSADESNRRQVMEVMNHDISVIKSLDEALNDREVFRLASNNKRFINKVRSMITDTGRKAITSGEGTHQLNEAWVHNLAPNLSKLVNSPVPTQEQANISIVKSARSGTHTIIPSKPAPAGVYEKNSDQARNLQYLREHPDVNSEGTLNVAHAVSMKEGNAQFAKNSTEIDPNSGMTYVNANKVQQAFKDMVKSSTPENTQTYIDAVKTALPQLMTGETDIENMGLIYVQTGYALEVMNAVHFPSISQSIGGFALPAGRRNTSVYADRSYTRKDASASEITALRKMGEKDNVYGQLEGDIKGVLKLMIDNTTVELDNILYNDDNLNAVVGVAADTQRTLRGALVEVGMFFGIIKSAFGDAGKRLNDAQYGDNDYDEKNKLTSGNRSRLQRYHNRVQRLQEQAGDPRKIGLQRQAVVEFKKLALTYRLSGMVQGESTGGRTISNQDFEVMMDALWGNQTASKAKLQSLLQRVGAIRAINRFTVNSMKTGSYHKLQFSQTLDRLGDKLYTSFHDRMRKDVVRSASADRAIIDPTKITEMANAVPENFASKQVETEGVTDQNIIASAQRRDEAVSLILGKRFLERLDRYRTSATKILQNPNDVELLEAWDIERRSLVNMYASPAGQKDLMMFLRDMDIKDANAKDIITTYSMAIEDISLPVLNRLGK